ncbi:LamB/YcsF family protein [Romboutsia sp.]|uniref:LamB/YcsF family protein n=1 Tax=Romboutsia sp. TaxID=1965302 RepID=UPI0039C961DA
MNLKLGIDEEILNYMTFANIACGLHAGDAICMNTTVNIHVNTVFKYVYIPDLWI